MVLQLLFELILGFSIEGIGFAEVDGELLEAVAFVYADFASLCRAYWDVDSEYDLPFLNRITNEARWLCLIKLQTLLRVSFTTSLLTFLLFFLLPIHLKLPHPLYSFRISSRHILLNIIFHDLLNMDLLRHHPNMLRLIQILLQVSLRLHLDFLTHAVQLTFRRIQSIDLGLERALLLFFFIS